MHQIVSCFCACSRDQRDGRYSSGRRDVQTKAQKGGCKNSLPIRVATPCFLGRDHWVIRLFGIEHQVSANASRTTRQAHQRTTHSFAVTIALSKIGLSGHDLLSPALSPARRYGKPRITSIASSVAGWKLSKTAALGKLSDLTTVLVTSAPLSPHVLKPPSRFDSLRI